MRRAPADALWVGVYYEDTDFSGRVYHASYLRFLERDRTGNGCAGAIRASGSCPATSGVVFVMRSLQVEYLGAGDDGRSSGRRDERRRCARRVDHIQQRVLRGDKALVTASVLAASLRNDRPAPIPAELRHRLQPPG